MATVGAFHWYVHLKGPTKNWPICLAEYAVRVAPFGAGSQTRTALVPCCGLLLTVRGVLYLVGAPQESSRTHKGRKVSHAFASQTDRLCLSRRRLLSSHPAGKCLLPRGRRGSGRSGARQRRSRSRAAAAAHARRRTTIGDRACAAPPCSESDGVKCVNCKEGGLAGSVARTVFFLEDSLSCEAVVKVEI